MGNIDLVHTLVYIKLVLIYWKKCFDCLNNRYNHFQYLNRDEEWECDDLLLDGSLLRSKGSDFLGDLQLRRFGLSSYWDRRGGDFCLGFVLWRRSSGLMLRFRLFPFVGLLERLRLLWLSGAETLLPPGSVFSEDWSSTSPSSRFSPDVFGISPLSSFEVAIPLAIPLAIFSIRSFRLSLKFSCSIEKQTETLPIWNEYSVCKWTIFVLTPQKYFFL